MQAKIKKYLPWVIGIIIICIYRLFIIKDYLSQYTDDDQALMWYGTSLAAHFKLVEPHFLGQAYGSMIESVIAVPFYWLGIPLNICLPLATLLLWIAPFAILSFVCIKRDKPISACLCLLVTLLANWDYDILTNVPRSFIGGFIFAFIGILLLECKSKTARMLSLVFMSIGFVNTETTITIIALGILHYALWNVKRVREDYIYFVNGGLLGLLIVWYCNKAFYKMNPEYNLHGSNSLTIKLDALKTNLSHLGSLLSSFSLVNIKGIPILLFAFVLAILILLIYFKKWKDLFLVACAIGGSLSFLALPKTLDYRESLLFSQARMFLFIPYVILLIIFYLSYIEHTTDWGFIKLKSNDIVCLLVIILVAVGIGKIGYFEKIVRNNELLYYDPVVVVKKTSTIYDMAKVIREKVEETGVETVIFQTDNRGIGYATSAINYRHYLGYNAFFDRRTSTYLYLKDTVYNGDVLMVESDGTNITNMHTEKLDGISPIDWLKKQYNIQRYPEGSRFYIKSQESALYDEIFSPLENKLSVSNGLQDGIQEYYVWSDQLFETTIENEKISDEGLHIEILTPLSYYVKQDSRLIPFVHAYVNGKYIQDICLTEGVSTCDLNVDKSEDNIYRIVLSTNCFFVPSEIGIGEDERILSLGIIYIGNKR